MASSLDKLKELTDRLEDKIGNKNGYYQNAPLLSKYSQYIVNKESKVVDKVIIEEVESNNNNEDDKDENIEVIKIEEELLKTKTTPSKSIRRANITMIEKLYKELKIFEKSPDFDNIFHYKAMNLSGIGLKNEDFGEIRTGKYIQVIAITYEPDSNGKKKAKNISLGYFGKGETIDPQLKNKIIEFVLRWRYEKAFQNVQHYKELISKLD
ncbi:hypothetical protein MNB_SV-9-137 [hydrothermal vent metagenome]|uniref:Uncharacterized protein n=1 Tax=hydrothermal vent metagenome TaxID=652676 RepID=A0A1W1BS67_9ZZZZ